MVFSFNLLVWCITLIDLWILKNPCIPGIKPTYNNNKTNFPLFLLFDITRLLCSSLKKKKKNRFLCC